ncbi:MAG: NAD(P)/FAD-dependent oxidoreductase, partial [Acidobacteriota bacterium]
MGTSAAGHHGRKLSSLAPNESFWREAIDTEHLEPPLEGTQEADVVLVGGGYTSLVAAYFLKRLRPELEVAVLESQYVGFGSSGRNAGMVLHELHWAREGKHGAKSVRFTYDRTVDVVDVIQEIAEESGFDCELERTGYFEIGLHPAHVRRMEQIQAMYRKLGVELPVLSRDDMYQSIRSRRFVGALAFPRAAMLHPGKYIAGLKNAVKKAGVQLFEQTPVKEIRPGNEVEVRTPDGRVRAPKLVLGLNAYLPASRLGIIRDRAVSLFSFIILTEPLADTLWKELGWPGRQGYSDLRRIHNYVRVTGKRILFGGRVLYHVGVHSPSQLHRIYGRLYRELMATFPCLDGISITHRWCGPVALTWRRTPLIGRAGNGGNIYYALGYSGMGVSLGTLSGRVLADLTLGREGRWENLLYL